MGWSPLGGSRWLFLVALAVCVNAARASDVETREFKVLVDGKRAGDAQMTIHRADDGTLSMHCDTEINVKVGPIRVYSYKYRGRETWKDGKLVRFQSTCNDDGKHYDVQAEAKDDGLHVTVNNVERTVNGDVWLTSYWQEPDKKKYDTQVALVDADCGRDLDGQLRLLGAEQKIVDGREQQLKHFELTGKVNVELWYDAAGRLVRQEWLEEGHRTRLELKYIRR
jgi:YD repeat-containing protein